MKDEIYEIAIFLERFASVGLKEEYKKQISEIVNKLIDIAKRCD